MDNVGRIVAGGIVIASAGGLIFAATRKAHAAPVPAPAPAPTPTPAPLPTPVYYLGYDPAIYRWIWLLRTADNYPVDRFYYKGYDVPEPFLVVNGIETWKLPVYTVTLDNYTGLVERKGALLASDGWDYLIKWPRL